MKVKFNYDDDQATVMEVVGCTKERMDEMMEAAQKHMVKHNPTGSRVEMLEQIIEQCTSTEEVIAGTIVWQTVTNQMQQHNNAKEMQKKMESESFANRMKIRRD